MAGAYVSEAHINPGLTDFATGYKNGKFIADLLSPVVSCDMRSDTYRTRSRRDATNILEAVFGPETEARSGIYNVSSSTFKVVDYGLRLPVNSADLDANNGPLDPRQGKTQQLMNSLLLAREFRAATQFTTSGNYASTAAAATVWTNKTTATPVDDILTAIRRIAPSSEESRLVAWCSIDVWHTLRMHPQILALKGATSGMISRAEFGEFFDCDELAVSDAQRDTANPGQASGSYSRLWGTTVFGIARVPLNPSGKDIESFACTFRLGGQVRVREYAAPHIGPGGSVMIQAEHSDDEVLPQNDMATLITSVA